MPRMRTNYLLLSTTIVSFLGPAQVERAPASEQGARQEVSRNRIELAQVPDSKVSFSVYVDKKKNVEIIKEGENSGAVVYESANQVGSVAIRPIVRSIEVGQKTIDIVGEWKSDKPVATDEGTDFEKLYPPLFLTLELRNNSGQPLQITNGYVAVDQSSTDLQPYLKLHPLFASGCTDHEKLNPKLHIFNVGWGGVQNGKITYTFSKKLDNPGTPDSDLFKIKDVAFNDSTELSLLEGLKGIGANISRLRSEDFKCASRSQLPRCTSELVQSGVLGRIPPDSLGRDQDGTILVASVAGLIEYEWVDSHGATHQRRSKFESKFPLLTFKVPGEGAECGAGAPEDRDHKPLKLALDRADYRVPIRINETIRPGETKRLALNLNADKSSQHVFRIVLRSADGATFVSNTFDLLFFKPKIPEVTAEVQ